MGTQPRVESEAIDEAKWLEEERERLSRQCELTDSFWLGFVFCPAGETAADLRRLVERIGRSRDEEQRRQPGASGVILMRPRKPDELRHLLIPLFDARTASAWCVWVDVMDVEHTGRNQDEAVPTEPWAEAWSWLMLRTNERRDRLRRHLNGGVVFAVRNEWKALARNAAPDLWSVRSIVIETPKPQ